MPKPSKKRPDPFLVSVLVLAMPLVGRTALAENPGRPNIVVLLCDDLGYGDLACYGHPHIKTPNIDGLADNGILFTDFYSAAPVCSPSRVGLLTGRSPNRAGVYDWIPVGNKARNDRRDQVHMRKSEITIPALLKSSGYQTFMAGKWHCNSKFNSDEQPQPGDFGFDHWLSTQNNAAPSHAMPSNFVRNGQPLGETSEFSCHVVVSEAIQWLKDSNQDEPFFMFLPFHEPHEPVASPEPLVGEYRDVAQDDDEAHFFANVANVDAAVGRLKQELANQEKLENTLIVFTSDNGPETLDRYPSANRSYGRPGPLRGMKLHTTEAGFRVAGIMTWPAMIQPGQTTSLPISSLDLLPTFCELANVSVPSERVLDGQSVASILRDLPNQSETFQRNKPLVWAYYNATNETRVAMRDGRWKVLAKLNAGKQPRLQNVTTATKSSLLDVKLTDFEIYDLEEDLSETRNLMGVDEELSRILVQRLEKYYRELLDDSFAW